MMLAALKLTFSPSMPPASCLAMSSHWSARAGAARVTRPVIAAASRSAPRTFEFNVMMKSPLEGAFKRRRARSARMDARISTRGVAVLSHLTCYAICMSKLLDEAIRQVEQLPEGQQDAAAGALLDYVKHMQEIRLTDEQIAEVRRRRADPNRNFLSLDEVRARVERFGS